MKIIAAIIVFVCIVIGYNLYETNNSPDEIIELPTTFNELSIENADNEISEEVEVQHGATLSKQEPDYSEEPHTVEDEISSPEEAIIDDYTQKLPEGKVNELSEMEKIALQEQELSEWALVHQEWLYEMLHSKGEAFSDRAFIKNFIRPGIEHLDDDDKRSFQNIGLYREVPILLQEPEIDDEWAIRTEKLIKDFIEQQIQNNNFELYSVTCKQLTCEIIGAEYFPGSWNSISVYLIGQLKSSISTNSGWGKGVLGKNGVKYIYRILLFK